MRVFCFNYKAIIEKKGEELDVIAYNSPYISQQDQQSIDDIKYALKDTELNGKYSIEIESRFLEQKDGSYNQIFNICQLKEIKE